MTKLIHLDKKFMLLRVYNTLDQSLNHSNPMAYIIHTILKI